MKIRALIHLIWVMVISSTCQPTSEEDQDTSNATEMEKEEKKYEQIELVIDAKAKLGEGAIWDHRSETLYWVDIEGKALHLYDLASDQDRSLPTPHRIGTVVPAEQEGLAVVALQEGIFAMNTQDGQLNFIANPLQNQENIRFNDGKCDPLGRLWVGSMHLQAKSEAASLYRLNSDGSSQVMVEKVTISNGLVWSHDKEVFYYIDTPTKQVRAFEYDLNEGTIQNPKVAIEIDAEYGSPDGMTIDEEGKLWIAHWGGHAVIRWDPMTGEQLEKIDVPALNVTSCAFGGADLDILFITTASIGMNEEEKANYPQAGGVFAVRPGVRGVPAYYYQGKL